jgi:hypothetical protein
VTSGSSPRRWQVAALAPALAVGLGLAACRDVPTAVAHLAVTVSVTQVTGPDFSTDTTDGFVISCDVDLRAEATGSGRVTWKDAVFRWYAGADRTTAADSSVIPAATVRASWDQDDIGAGETQRSAWRVSALVPFAVAIVYRFQQAGGGWVDSASASFACGPTPAPGDPLPDIPALATSATDALEPGDTIDVDYQAESPLGLWQTSVALEGSCEAEQVFNENLQHAVSRRVRLPLPVSCPLGVSLDLRVTASDGALRGTVRSRTLPGLVDVTPPVANPFRSARDGGQFRQTFGGDFWVGDTITLTFAATDNHALAMLLWEVQPFGFRDSLAVSGSSVSPAIRIAWRPEWTGLPTLRFYARDAAGQTSAVVESAPDSVRLFPTSALVASTAFVPDVWDVAFAPGGDVIYLLQPRGQHVRVFSPATMSVVATIDLPGYAPSFDLTVSGDSIVTVLPERGAIGIVDLLRTPPALTLVPLSGLDSAKRQLPKIVRVAGNGTALVSTSGATAGADQVIAYNFATRSQRLRLDAGLAGSTGAGALEHSPDRSIVVLNGGPQRFQRYDAASDAFSPGLTATLADATPRVDRGAQHVAVNGDIYDADLRFVLRVHRSNLSVAPVALSPDGLTHYAIDWDVGIVRSRVSDGWPIDRIRNPIRPELVRASPDGRLLVTLSQDQSQISIVTLR